MKQFNAVGIIKPFPSSIKHATAILISPCHVLINSHAVPNLQAKKSLEYVYISLGQSTCDKPNEFAYSNISGKVIAMGDNSELEEKIDNSRDYAIVKLIQSINDIELPVISEEPINADNIFISVGFPKHVTLSIYGFFPAMMVYSKNVFLFFGLHTTL